MTNTKNQISGSIVAMFVGFVLIIAGAGSGSPFLTIFGLIILLGGIIIIVKKANKPTQKPSLRATKKPTAIRRSPYTSYTQKSTKILRHEFDTI